MERHIGSLIKELHRRSGLSREDYARILRIEPTHLSAIENGNQPGSMKTLEAALNHQHMGFSDLRLREAEPSSEDELELLRLFRTLSTEHRSVILVMVKSLASAEEMNRRRNHVRERQRK